MKAQCNLSGLIFATSFLTGVTANPHSKVSNVVHPIMSLTVSEVLPQLPSVPYMVAMPAEDTHLLGTFLLSKLPVSRWEAPLLSETFPLTYWEGFWHKHMQKLVKIATQLEGKSWNSKLPLFSVATDAYESGAAPASNLGDWLTTAELEISAFTAPISDEARKKNREYQAAITENTYYSEAHIADIIRKGLQGSLMSAKETKEYPSLIAKWARKVGEFPVSKIQLASGRKVILADLWEDILIKGFKLDGSGLIDLLVGDVTVGDVEEILEHCSVTILRDDSVMASTFLRELAKIAEALEEFRNPMPSKRAISTASSSELLDLLGSNGEVSEVDSYKSLRQADKDEPQRADFKSIKDYLAARKAYSAAKGAADTIVNL